MFKRFADHGEALKYGRTFGSEHGVQVFAASVYLSDGKGSVTFLATAPHLHLLPYQGPKYSPGFSWYFGGDIGHMDTDPLAQQLLTTADQDALPGRLEYWYWLVACTTQGYTPEAMLAIACICEETGCGVWHACSEYAGHETCPCAKCK